MQDLCISHFYILICSKCWSIPTLY